MDQVPVTRLICYLTAFLVCLTRADSAIGQESIDKVYGTEDGAIVLVEPATVTAESLSDGTPAATAETGNAGTSAEVSRADHVHASTGSELSDATPEDLGTAASGSSAEASRGDHVHKRPTEIADNSAAIILNRAAIAGKPDIGSSSPKPVGNSANSGSSTKASRQDHRHKFSNYGSAIKAVGNANNAGVLDQTARVDHVHKSTGGSGGGGATEFTGLTDTPSDYTGAGGQLVAVNADADALVFTDGLTDLTLDVESNADDIDELTFATQDITAGIPSSGWADVSDTTELGIALFNNAADCTAARAASYQTAIKGGAAGKYSIVRVKAGFTLGNGRVLVTGNRLNEEFPDLLTGWSLLCLSADNAFGYYHELYTGGAIQWGADVDSVEMQTTGSSHIGTSSYSGTPTKVEDWAIKGDTTGIPISKTLPSITGHDGNFLAVNTAGTGIEWKAAGGGGSGGGGGEWELIDSVKTLANTTDNLFYFDGTKSLVCYQNANAGTHEFLVTVNFEGQSWPFYATRSDAVSGSGDTRTYEWRWTGTDDVLDGNFQNNALIILRCQNSTAANRTSFRVITKAAIAKTVTVNFYQRPYASGGGGSSGPSIPKPTAAGALDYLRVNAAGAAYELADFPAIPAASSAVPKAATAIGSPGTSNQWSPADHSHPLEANDTVVWTGAQVTTLTGGGASGGVTCDGSDGGPTATECQSMAAAMRRGEYRFIMARVTRWDTNTPASDPAHVSGCSLFPGIPGSVLSDSITWEAACTGNSGKNSANTFNQYDVFAKFGNTGNYIQVRLPNYNSYGVDTVTVSLTGVR